MATLATKYQTLLDLATESDGKGTLLPIVEMMSEVNSIIQDMPMVQCNSGTFHKSVMRSGLPAGTFRKIYGGVQPEKSEKISVVNTTCMLESFSEVDEALAVLSGNPNRYRLREAKSFIEGLSQTMAEVLFYGDTAKNPERINGFAQRYNSYGTTKGKSSYNVISGSGSNSDNASIWLINWGEDFVSGIYPTGGRSKIGITHDPIGRQKKDLSDGSSYMTLVDHFIAEFGLSVSDWRRVVRICNLKTGNFGGASAPNLLDLMRKATYRIPGGATNQVSGRLCWYMNADCMEELERQYYSATNMQLFLQNADGKPIATYRGIPIRLVEQLKSSEATVGADS